MLKGAYNKLRTMVALPDAGTRRQLRKALQYEGLHHCREAPELPTLAGKLADGDVDLLITTIDEDGWDSADTIRRLRHGLFEANPFMVVMGVLERPTPMAISRIVDSGIDDLLLSPWNGRQMIDRLDGFVQGRKPFLITYDYIGPERRLKLRNGDVIGALMDVPNPIRWWHDGNTDREDFHALVGAARVTANTRKVECCAGQLRQVAEKAVADFVRGGAPPLRAHIITMLAVSDELVRRAADSAYGPAVELTSSFRQLCQRLVRVDRLPRNEEVMILPSLAEAIRVSLTR